MKATHLLQLATQAIQFAGAVARRRQAEEVLRRAYYSWKFVAGLDYVERDTDAWCAMTEATETEYRALARAKRQERYYRDRLLKLAGAAQAEGA